MREIEDLILILLEFGILPTFRKLHKFFFKEVRTWVSPRFHLVVFVIGVNQEP